MDGRNLGWLQWVLVIGLGALALPVLLVPALLVLPFLAPFAIVALPVLSMSLLGRS